VSSKINHPVIIGDVFCKYTRHLLTAKGIFSRFTQNKFLNSQINKF